MSVELIFAAMDGDVAEVQRLLREEALFSLTDVVARTALSSAVKRGDNPIVKCLIKEGRVDINTMITFEDKEMSLTWLLESLTELWPDIKHGNYGPVQRCSVLSWAARHGNYVLAQWLIQEGAVIPIWIWENLGNVVEHADAAELSSLLKVLLLFPMSSGEDCFLDAVLLTFVANLSPQHACERGCQLRYRLPAYLEQQRTSVGTHLPGVLEALVAAYALHTPEELWSDGLQWLDSADIGDGAG
jgi:hypothetical protein